MDATALILDAEAVNALARPRERRALAERAHAILTVAFERSALVRVPAPVLAEVCRGGALDAAVNRILHGRGLVIADLTRPIAQRAGQLLARARLGSAHAVDAFVVATALEFGRSLIATADPDDIKRLAARSPHVEVFPL